MLSRVDIVTTLLAVCLQELRLKGMVSSELPAYTTFGHARLQALSKDSKSSEDAGKPKSQNSVTLNKTEG